MRYACGLRKPSRARRRCAVRACQAEQSREAKALLRHTPHEINVASCTLYQAEGRVLLRWEASKQNPSAASAISASQASCSARSLSVLYAARRSPSVLVLSYERYISTAKLTAHRSLQALQGTTKKQRHPAKSIPSKTPRAVASCTEPRRRNSRAAANHATPRWPTPTSPHNRRFRPRRRKRRPRPRRPP